MRKDRVLLVHQYLRKSIQQFRGGHVAKLGGVMLSLMVLSIAGFSLNASTPYLRNHPSKTSLKPDARPSEAEAHSAISHWNHITGQDASAATSAACSDQSYSVQAGDTLSGIAQQYHQSWSALAQANHLANPNVIFVGQQICLDGSAGAAQADPPAYAPARVWQAPQAAQPQVLSGSSVVGMISQVFGSYAGGAMNVARCESGLNPSATNPSSGAAGLFQIMPATFNGTSQAGRSIYDAYTNIVAAHDIFVRDGYSWRAWAC